MAVPAQLMQLLGHAGLRRILASHRAGGSGITVQLDEDDQEGLEDRYDALGTRRKQRAKGWKNKFPPVPSEEGKKLMDGGVFGSSGYYRDNRMQRKTRLARKLMSRELGIDRYHSARANNAVSQVWIINMTLPSICIQLTEMGIGHATFLECRHDHSL